MIRVCLALGLAAGAALCQACGDERDLPAQADGGAGGGDGSADAAPPECAPSQLGSYRAISECQSALPAVDGGPLRPALCVVGADSRLLVGCSITGAGVTCVARCP